ncbi:hypothetical protein RHSIM_Rhsim01G0263800 [Rhododendron simsii]|uniref:Cupin type-1 domain-containing protein n=1 Tax=Rhododendron simsii TaxID=118357 RepID=A0A834LY24_RHOSS|nr:hypothetical protein RHSIM_Rhsim01G0263800 [Rhododendron simsii]
MATNKLALLLALSLSLLASVALGRQSQTRLSRAQQCRFNQLTRLQPSRRIESEGGVTDVWDENEDQFQCAGVAPLRNILQPNSLSLPNFHPAPRLVYIERGQGLLGVHFPGCAETFQSQQSSSEGGREQEQGRGRSGRDQHQKIRRIRRGDIVALPSGVAHWCFNDGDEELVAVSITDLNNEANQLDQNLRAYYLAGGPQKRGRQGERGPENFQNVLRGFDEELMAEAFNVDREIVRKMQRQDERGLIVKVREGMGMIRPDEREEEEEGEWGRRMNGIEETWCTMRLHHNVDDRREAEVYSREGGRLNVVNRNKLPILRYMDLSAEKGHLFPNALYTPHWSINSHSIVYITRGEGQVQIADHRGQSVMNDRVSQGDMFVVPQFYAATVKAQSNGIEWVSFKTNGSPMRSPVAGYTSVLRAMPLQVISNSYQISPGEAQNLKYNRGRETVMASPRRS